MIPKGLSWKFSVMDGSKAVADVVDLWWWPAKGELTVQGVTYKAHRERAMSGAFVLESAAGVLARAEKPSALRRSLVIEHSGRRYTLRAMHLALALFKVCRRTFTFADSVLLV